MTTETYNPHAMIEVREGEGTVRYSAIDVETKLAIAKSRDTILTSVYEQIDAIRECMTAEDWYSESTDKAEVLTKLEEILKHYPTTSVSITATIEVYMTVEVPLKELEDFDADTAVTDNLSVDTTWGDATVDSWEINSADWEQQ